jgi:hypothetical protein
VTSAPRWRRRIDWKYVFSHGPIEIPCRQIFQVFEQIISLLGISVVDIREYGSTRMTGSLTLRDHPAEVVRQLCDRSRGSIPQKYWDNLAPKLRGGALPGGQSRKAHYLTPPIEARPSGKQGSYSKQSCNESKSGQAEYQDSSVGLG